MCYIYSHAVCWGCRLPSSPCFVCVIRNDEWLKCVWAWSEQPKSNDFRPIIFTYQSIQFRWVCLIPVKRVFFHNVQTSNMYSIYVHNLIACCSINLYSVALNQSSKIKLFEKVMHTMYFYVWMLILNPKLYLFYITFDNQGNKSLINNLFKRHTLNDEPFFIISIQIKIVNNKRWCTFFMCSIYFSNESIAFSVASENVSIEIENKFSRVPSVNWTISKKLLVETINDLIQLAYAQTTLLSIVCKYYKSSFISNQMWARICDVS